MDGKVGKSCAVSGWAPTGVLGLDRHPGVREREDASSST